MIAATHLDAVAFQIFSQSFKLVPTALFAYWLLGQMLEPMQARRGWSFWSAGWSFLRWFAASFHCMQPAAQSSQQVASGSFSLAQLSTNCLSSCPPPGCTLQWASIPVLALGVILVTVNNGGGSAKSAAAAAVSSSSHGLDYVAGMVACSISGLSSAYAGGPG